MSCIHRTFIKISYDRGGKAAHDVHLGAVSVANENVSLVISRQILTEFCSYFSSLPDAVGKEVAHFTLDKVQPRVVSFEEQVTTLRYFMNIESSLVFFCYHRLFVAAVYLL